MSLKVPTPGGFAAMKLLAWFDRHTPRDLYDLAALADAGHIDQAALQLVRSIAGYTPSTLALERKVPRSVESSWLAELGHQASDLTSPDDCLDRVRRSLELLSPIPQSSAIERLRASGLLSTMTSTDRPLPEPVDPTDDAVLPSAALESLRDDDR